MMFADFIGLGSYAERIKSDAWRIADQTKTIKRYVNDTARGEGQADFDLVFAAEMLEHTALQVNEAARKLRALHARVQQERADLSNPLLTTAA